MFRSLVQMIQPQLRLFFTHPHKANKFKCNFDLFSSTELVPITTVKQKISCLCSSSYTGVLISSCVCSSSNTGVLFSSSCVCSTRNIGVLISSYCVCNTWNKAFLISSFLHFSSWRSVFFSFLVFDFVSHKCFHKFSTFFLLRLFFSCFFLFLLLLFPLYLPFSRSLMFFVFCSIQFLSGSVCLLSSSWSCSAGT